MLANVSETLIHKKNIIDTEYQHQNIPYIHITYIYIYTER